MPSCGSHSAGSRRAAGAAVFIGRSSKDPRRRPASGRRRGRARSLIHRPAQCRRLNSGRATGIIGRRATTAAPDARHRAQHPQAAGPPSPRRPRAAVRGAAVPRASARASAEAHGARARQGGAAEPARAPGRGRQRTGGTRGAAAAGAETRRARCAATARLLRGGLRGGARRPAAAHRRRARTAGRVRRARDRGRRARRLAAGHPRAAALRRAGRGQAALPRRLRPLSRRAAARLPAPGFLRRELPALGAAHRPRGAHRHGAAGPRLRRALRLRYGGDFRQPRRSRAARAAGAVSCRRALRQRTGAALRAAPARHRLFSRGDGARDTRTRRRAPTCSRSPRTS